MEWSDVEAGVKWPTLLVAYEWVEQHCVVPDGFQRGERFELVPWQAWALLNFYRLKLDAKVGQLAPAFHYRRGQIVLPQKAGKAPYTAAHICVEGVGPALFAGWAAGGETWDCRDYGCGCGWLYEYDPGEAMGQPWPTPLIQITATSEDQTENVYDALRPMIDDGPLHELIPKTGEEFIRLPGGGRIDVVTSSAKSRLGQRVTYCPQDETGTWVPATGMQKVAEIQRRGLAGMGGRAEETTNAWDPGEGSTAQRTAESKRPDIFRYHPEPPTGLNYPNKSERRKIHRAVYIGCHWIDLDSIEAEAAELIETDPAQAERFFGNRTVAGSHKAFDADLYRSLAKPGGIEPGRKVALGFDGALTRDATGLVTTDIETGHQVVAGFWERPRELPDNAEWMVPIGEVNAAIAHAFETWDVWRLYADPPHYQDDLNRWAGEYGEDRIVLWWTNHYKRMAYALRQFKDAMAKREMSHDGDGRLAEHVANAVRRVTRMRDEDGGWLWTIGKEGEKSPNKIDLAMAACLSWAARGDAIQAGVLKEPQYSRAAWQDGEAPKARQVKESDYLPCRGCEKPIHPDLHAPDANEGGLCMRCRSKRD